MPEWVLKLARRIMALRPGRYAIILTVGDMHDWTVAELGKVEFSQSDPKRIPYIGPDGIRGEIPVFDEGGN